MLVRNRHILIIGGRDPSIEMLKNLPIDVTMFQTPDRVTPTQYQVAKRLVITTLDDEEVIKLAYAIHQYHPFDAAISFLENYLLITARICELLCIRGNPIRAVELTIDKSKMREEMLKLNIPSVKSIQCSNKKDVINALKTLKSPIVLKPNKGMASIGVSLIKSLDEIENVWKYVSSRHEEFATEEYKEEFIAEEYIDGREYSIECLSNKGIHTILAITAKDTTGTPHFIETGHQQPALLDASSVKLVNQVIIQFFDQIGHREGPTHTEIRIRKKVPYIIESHTRYGGDKIWEMVYLTKGLYIPQAAVCQLLDFPIPQHKQLYKAAAIKFIISAPKVCNELYGIEDAARQQGIYRVEIYVKPGMEIKPLVSSFERCGYVLGGGSTLEEAASHVQKAASLIHIR